MVLRRQISFHVLGSANRLFPPCLVRLPRRLADSREKATLHQATLFAIYNHPSGWFGRLEGYWAQQSNVGYSPGHTRR